MVHQLFGSFVSGNILGGLSSSASTIGSLIGQFNKADLLPNIKGGSTTGDVLTIVGENKFSIKEMRVKTEYLKIIDDYFTKYGYSIKKIETPNIKTRKVFNYLEIGSNEIIGTGSVVSQHMSTINNICRKGVTIWHNHNNIGNYDLDNSNI